MSYLPSNHPDLLLAIIDCYFKKTYLKKNNSGYTKEQNEFLDKFWKMWDGNKK